MKKKIFFVITLIIFILFILINNKEKEIKVRIIPNSNDECDLMIKEKVKERVVKYLKTQMSNTYEATFNNINNTYITLKNDILKDLNVETNVTFDKHILYNKTYNNIAQKDEKTYCLYVVIGKGMGSNWWGSVFPKFLEVSSESTLPFWSVINTCSGVILGTEYATKFLIAFT